MQPLVSIIITCLNCERFLSTAVNNSLAQTYSNIECIIVDDGSTDSTASLASTLMREDSRIKYVFNTTDKHSPAAARNFGVQHAKGEWIQFYDVDDHLYPYKIKDQLDSLDKQNIDTQNAMVIYSDFEVIWEDNNGVEIKKITNIIGDHSRDGLLEKIMSWHIGPTMPLHVNSTLFKRSIFKDKHFNTDLIIFEEIELFTDLLLNNIQFIYVPILAMSYCIHGANLTKDYNRSRLGYIQFLNIILEKDPALLKHTSKRINILIERAVKELDLEIFNNLMKIISRANIRFCYPWKGKSIRNIYLMYLIFWVTKITRMTRNIFSPKPH